MKITVNLETCQHMGQCVYEAPAVFSLDEAGKLIYLSDVDSGLRVEVEAAIDLCPTQSISID